MKIITKPKNFSEIENTISLVDAYIIGIENMSVNENMYVKKEELDKINKYLKEHNKELFISLNKNMHNKDIDKIKEIMLYLNNLDIKGLIYYDVSIVSLKDKLNINYDLVWASEHYTTNYDTINYWYDFGINYTMLSSEITKEEVIEISNNTKAKLILPLFGYLPMYVSKRHGIKNYLEYFNLKDNSKINYLEKEGNFYPIIDNEVGTYAYSCNILNGIKEVLDLNNKIDYMLLNSFNIDDKLFIEIVKMFKEVNSNNIDSFNNSINKMFNNTDSGFLYKETISKVKKNE